MTEDLMKFTKAELVELLEKATKQLVVKKKKIPGQNYPIQPETPFEDMGKMEHGRWRFRYLSYLIKHDDGKHDILYTNSLRRNRVREMKICNEWFIMLKESNFKESEKWQKQYDVFVKLIKSEASVIPKIPSIGFNKTGK